LNDILPLIGREQEVFIKDIENNKAELEGLIKGSSIVVIGGAGSIGQATVKELFKRNPENLFVVDISENNLAELVRDIRSSIGYIEGDVRTCAISSQSKEFELFFSSEGPFDYVLNLSALKHVRSEKDPYTLMRIMKNRPIAAPSDVKRYFVTPEESGKLCAVAGLCGWKNMGVSAGREFRHKSRVAA
jgi:NAD(P)-dependent dehydrogenase (short-subunit alcohol dehydrogenase family)